MKITIFGVGYVGLVVGTCLASMGNDVKCIDTDKKKVDMLNAGKIPIFEPGLKEMVELNSKEGRLIFSTDEKMGIEHADVLFVAVGTPSDENGKADLKYVRQVAASIGKYMKDYMVIVDKSTVPVGTADMVQKTIKENQPTPIEFDMCSNPEFLREGEALKDFMNPDRIVVGTQTKKAEEIMNKLYAGIARTDKPIVHTDVKTAEMIKYAANAMLATRISFMNTLAPLCEKVGADVKKIARGIGLDNRIGPRFLQAGAGYGGSCFPKDVRAIVETLRENGCDASLLESVDNINENQKKSLLPKIKTVLPDLKDKKIAIWGLAFKPKTDDMREAPSLVLIQQLVDEGADVIAFDPVAEENTKIIFPEIKYGNTPYETIKDCDALVIVTEWDEFRLLDLEAVKTLLKQPIIIDGRNIYNKDEMIKNGFKYISVGR